MRAGKVAGLAIWYDPETSKILEITDEDDDARFAFLAGRAVVGGGESEGE